MEELIIGLGSNLGDRRKNIGSAINLIRERIGPVSSVSSLVETEPWGFESEHKFLNCAVKVEVILPRKGTSAARAMEIIEILQSIEQESGRIRTGVYADRAIDLDILFYGDEIMNLPGLTIPHPKLHERDFVLVSLAEICPEKIHPVIGKSIRELWSLRS